MAIPIEEDRTYARVAAVGPQPQTHFHVPQQDYPGVLRAPSRGFQPEPHTSGLGSTVGSPPVGLGSAPCKLIALARSTVPALRLLGSRGHGGTKGLLPIPDPSRGLAQPTRAQGGSNLEPCRAPIVAQGGGGGQGLGIRLFAFGSAYWPLTTTRSDCRGGGSLSGTVTLDTSE